MVYRMDDFKRAKAFIMDNMEKEKAAELIPFIYSMLENEADIGFDKGVETGFRSAKNTLKFPPAYFRMKHKEETEVE